MKFKELGNSGEFIPAIGQGCMGIGGKFEKNTTNDSEFIWALEYGIDLGMTFLDTAEVYANGHSETLVGKASYRKRHKLFIATKFSPENSSYNNVLTSAENSLKRLKTSYIDLYQIHWPNPSIPLSETMKALEKLVNEGKVRFVGLSNFNKHEMEEAKRYLNPINIVSNQVEYNLFDRFIEYSLMDYMLKNESSIIAYSPLDKGHSFNKIEKTKLMNELSEKYNKTTSQISLNWLLSNKNVFVIPKAIKKKHIELNAASSDFEMDLIDKKRISKIFSANPKFINPNKIKVSLNGQDNRKVYQTIEEAIENRFNMQPSPLELSKFILKGDPIKPVRVISSNEDDKYDFDLIEGRLRFWAWCIAYNGEKDVPCIVR
ncbi:aldo/keto reductase [Alphaproteobacteria bacterium]|nr:aldo/keto reductase [Alphaproteobacteria bacterium]